MQYRVEYHCPICGQNIPSEAFLELDHESAIKFLTSVIQNQSMMGNPYLYKAPMHVIHHCDNGSHGLAFIAGLRRV